MLFIRIFLANAGGGHFFLMEFHKMIVNEILLLK